MKLRGGGDAICAGSGGGSPPPPLPKLTGSQIGHGGEKPPATPQNGSEPIKSTEKPGELRVLP